MADPHPDPARRRLLRGWLRTEPGPVRDPLRPPWTTDVGLADHCTRCGDCVRACPEKIIIWGDGGFPEIDFTRGECSFCRDCATACPEPVFQPADTPPWAARARIGDACLAGKGVLCQSCSDACPERAIAFRPAYGRPPQPWIDHDACTGCGACIAPCPVDAINVREDAVDA